MEAVQTAGPSDSGLQDSGLQDSSPPDQSPQVRNPPTFQTVWEALQETDRISKANAERFDREMEKSRLEWEESKREWDKRLEKSRLDWEKRFGKLTNSFGDLGNRFGEVVEHMIAPGLLEKFNDLGLGFLTVSNNFKVSDPVNNIFFEIDVKLDNTYKMMLVEIKTKLTIEDVKEHERRLEKMRLSDDYHGHKRMLLGAVAGVVIADNVKEYALKQGFYVIEPSGESFNITPPDNKPKEW